MTFKELNKLIIEQFAQIQSQNMPLFRVKMTGDQLWDTYITNFKPGDDPVFRDPQSTFHTCNNDRNFIRRYGNIVGVDSDFNLVSMFAVNVQGTIYETPMAALKDVICNSVIESIFVESFDMLKSLPYESCSRNQESFQLGMKSADAFGVVEAGKVYTFDHFYVNLDRKYVDFSSASVESLMGSAKSFKDVFERGMELPVDTLELVKDLILQGSLLNGDAHLHKVQEFLDLKKAFDRIPEAKQTTWCWVKSKYPGAKFRNELIGTLCVELAEGAELNEACRTWNKRVDPANYMKAKAPITQRQILEAQRFVEDNGYIESFQRRFATLQDIDVSEIRHMNVSTGVVKQAGLFTGVQPSTSTRHKRSQFEGVEEVSIEKFMRDILPTCTSIEAFIENRLEQNMVSLITAANTSKPMFKWFNNFSWTYNGNLTGKSQIKDNVKAAGGKITGVLRCSLQWNDEDTPGIVDYDLHCVTPFTTVYYSNKRCGKSGGWLDVDMIRPSKTGIENITWQSNLLDGIYKFQVHTFCNGNNTGFKVEIEFDGNTYNYHYARPSTYKSKIDVATVIVRNGIMSITHHLPETTATRSIWGLESNQFHKVNLVCLSPNYWGESSIGNKHYFFMLEGCASDVPLRAFHNEYLNGSLLEHRKVLEVLADTTRIEPSKPQLAGIGFNATVQDELIIKLTGSHKRVLKIKF